MAEFDYDKIIEIANRLRELGISEELVKSIKDWAWVRLQEENSRRNEQVGAVPTQ